MRTTDEVINDVGNVGSFEISELAPHAVADALLRFRMARDVDPQFCPPCRTPGNDPGATAPWIAGEPHTGPNGALPHLLIAGDGARGKRLQYRQSGLDDPAVETAPEAHPRPAAR